MSEDFDINKFYLGVLCKRNHVYRDNLSLRYKSTGQCTDCHKLTMSKTRKPYYDKNAEEIKRKKREYHRDNREAILPKLREYSKTESYKESSRKSREKNKEKIYQRTREWKANNIDKLRVHYSRRRLKERSKYERYTAEQIKLRYDEFNNECAYCGTKDDLTNDHIIPISKDGKDAIDNIIPACRTCNFRKSAKDVWEWFSRQISFTEERWDKIKQLLDKMR